MSRVRSVYNSLFRATLAAGLAAHCFGADATRPALPLQIYNSSCSDDPNYHDVGAVEISFTIDIYGNTRDVQVTSDRTHDALLVAAATNAVAKSRYFSALVSGSPVSSQMHKTFTYNCGSSLSGQTPIDKRLSSLMTQQEIIATGLTKLTAGEQSSLFDWVTRISQQVYAKGFGDGQRQTQTAQGLAATPRAQSREYPSVGGHHWIKENADGETIILEDGSVWEISSLDQLDARLWLRTDNITVVQIDDGLAGYDYLLIDTNDRRQVHAKYVAK